MSINDNPELILILQQIIEWHQSRVTNCTTIIENEDADLSFPQCEASLAANSLEAKWFRLGVSVALEQFQPCPIVLSQPDEGDDYDNE